MRWSVLIKKLRYAQKISIAVPEGTSLLGLATLSKPIAIACYSLITHVSYGQIELINRHPQINSYIDFTQLTQTLTYKTWERGVTCRFKSPYLWTSVNNIDNVN